MVSESVALTTIAQWYFQKRNDEKKRSFEEKKEAYVGFLDAMHALATENSNVNSKKYALWETRAILVGSSGVIKNAQGMKDTEPGTQERSQYFDSLLEEMRKDLEIDTRELVSTKFQ